MFKNTKTEESKINAKRKKRLTTVPQFDSTKKLFEENEKVVNLVTQK